MKQSKFRQSVSTKPKLSVHGKLPKSAFHYIVGYVEGELSHYRNQDVVSSVIEENDFDTFKENLNVVKQQLHNRTIPKISIVDSNSKTVRLVGQGELLISTSTLRSWVECLLKVAEDCETNLHKPRSRYNYNVDEVQYYKFAALKLLDIVCFVKESPFSVVSTSSYGKNKAQRDRYRYYSRTNKHHHNKRKHPFISKRYEKTTFHSRAKGMYEGKFSDGFIREWDSNLNYIYTPKGCLPLGVLNSEMYLSHQEL